MKALVATEFIIAVYNGKYYCNNALSSILERYCSAFGKVILCSRVRTAEEPEETLIDITDYIERVVRIDSLLAVLTGNCKKNICDEIKKVDLVIARLPSLIAYRAIDYAKKNGKPYFAESMTCPWDAFWNHGFSGKLIAPYMYFKMKNVVKDSNYALYVTDEFLQKRYPCKCRSTSASNVRLTASDDEILNKRLARIEAFDENNIKIMTSASVDVIHKGHKYVIKAMGKLKKQGINVTYYAVGSGDRSRLMNIAKKCGVLEQMVFMGFCTHDVVFEQLDNIDIYIQPSLQEGLPRAMIEALSRGCPALGAKTAGIPELVNPECVFKRKSAAGIVNAIKRISCKDKLLKSAKENFEKAKEYSDANLNKKRNSYYEYVISDMLKK